MPLLNATVSLLGSSRCGGGGGSLLGFGHGVAAGGGGAPGKVWDESIVRTSVCDVSRTERN